MAKKLLSEAQVRKFMGLANLDANLSSNFLSEMYGHKDDEKKMEEEKHEDEKKMEEKMHGDDEKDVMKEEEDEMDMDMPDADPEGGEDLGVADGAEDDKQALATKLMQAVADIMGVEVDIDSEPAGEMDAPEEPEMEMDDEPTMMGEVELELSEDEIVQEVAKRVAKRINEAARAQKKADRLLGRKK
jgi:hypothetical protein